MTLPTVGPGRRELLRCALLLVVVETGLRTLTLPRLVALLGLRLSTSTQPTLMPAVLPHWARGPLEAADVVTRHCPVGPEGKCLRRALVAGRRLRDLEPELVLGVRRGRAGIEAHAWLVVQGRALDPSAAEYVQLGAGR